MLVSHRRHEIPFAGTELSLDRLVAPTFLLRRVTIRGFVQDERFTKSTLGVDCSAPRHRLAIVLDHELRDYVRDRTVTVTAGQASFVPVGTAYASRFGDGELLELEWSATSRAETAGTFVLGPAARAAANALAKSLRTASIEPTLDACDDLRAALVAEGIEVSMPPSWRTRARDGASDQAVFARIDAALSQLSQAPMLVDLEDAMRSARRTLTRRIRSVHERYALLGRGGASWRRIRDAYRLVIASILVSHPRATPSVVAKLVGYRSPEALAHAFRHASLPSPLTLGRALQRNADPT